MEKQPEPKDGDEELVVVDRWYLAADAEIQNEHTVLCDDCGGLVEIDLAAELNGFTAACPLCFARRARIATAAKRQNFRLGL